MPRDEPPTDARLHLAWLMYCFQEGYVRAEDRAPMTNWLLHDPAMLNPLDLEQRDALLVAADEVLAALRQESKAAEPPFDSERYERCTDPDCPVAYAYRPPFPEVDHWHCTGPSVPEPSRWADL
jgi:hypothetical protein